MARRAYYLCHPDGDPSSAPVALCPSLAKTVAKYAGCWATCYQDATVFVVAVSDLMDDGSAATGLHEACALEAVWLGDTFDQACAALDPAISAEMHDAAAPV